MTRTCMAIVAAVLLAAPVAAQPSLTASVAPGITSLGGEGATGQFNASAGAEHLMKSERVRVFYDFETGDYATPGDWRFLSHSAGATYRLALQKNRTNYLYVGADATLRRNGDSWSAADFNAAGVFANLELHPGRATVRTGYRLDARRFPSSPALDQMQHSAFAAVLVSFDTRTTVIAEVTAGTKHYDAISSHTEVIVLPTEHVPEARGSGLGRWGGMANATLVPVLIPGAPGSDARQVTLFGRVAQSLTARTGVTVEMSRRRVSGDVSPALIATPASFFDDGIYDDLFASDATRRAVSVKSIAAAGIELSASLAWLDKDYGTTFAFGEDGTVLPDVLRSDRVTAAALQASWPLFPSRTGPVSLDLLTGYDYSRHRSTSALYRYTAHTVRVGIGITY